jgi:ribose-phosphate pyrophosphokinase
MIKIYSEDLNEYTFETTIFPDKTSQVWKINPQPTGNKLFTVEWKFENEAEVFHLMQLGILLFKLTNVQPVLRVDTLPYARQDKNVTNNSTFALEVLVRALTSSHYHKILTIDAHSSRFTGKDRDQYGTRYFIETTTPTERITNVLKESAADLICFPDKGASERGYSFDAEYYGAPIILDKDRDQETGEIKGLKFTTKFKPDLTGYKVCIIDDLCDGGRTFTEAAKILKEQGANEVILYTTHGIYSKGVETLFSNGIDRIFNYKTEVFSNLKFQQARKIRIKRKKNESGTVSTNKTS